ncbi:MAG: urea ABC transporter permease subunit UrtB [Verrucomicrobiales bacterium]|nr:urea ABC transporter permease subunit UrtB [Verrucomicrobiales bacterium]
MSTAHLPPRLAFTRRLLALVAGIAGFLVPTAAPAAEVPAHRTALVQAALSEDLDRQTALLSQLTGVADPLVEQALTAWRGGTLYIHESGDQKTPFLLDPQAEAGAAARGIRIDTGEFLAEANGTPATFEAASLTPVDATSKLRRAIKTTLDLLALGNPNPHARRDAILKLGQSQNAEYIPHFESRQKTETDPEVIHALAEALALTRLVSTEPKVRIAAIRDLESMRSIPSLTYLKQLRGEEGAASPANLDPETAEALRVAIRNLEEYIWWGEVFGTAFRGLSLAAVLLVAALGLAITFGLMGVINMAHGEVIMVGAYTAYVVQNLFQSAFGAGSTGLELYFPVALIAAFVTAGLVGLILERGVIRFLYRRPLESLLATWGVSLVLQQMFRHAFGAANVQVNSPSWLSGSFVVNDILLAYNRLFVIGFALFIVFATFALLTRTSLGLQIRAVMQNRHMAAALGVRTSRVNMLTFAFGSGLAGMAGACLSQIGNVGPSLGQTYIVDCFMVVVLGGVGNLIGTILAALGVGVTDQILQPWLGAVMGKIVVLSAIILFLQWRPAGLFVTRSRSLEG